MSNPGEEDRTPIGSVRQLAEYLEAGCTAPGDFRLGTEHEKFGFCLDDFAPVPYAPDGIGAVLGRLRDAGWNGILDQDALIGLHHEGSAISLEPAGQFELSGAPRRTLHETRAEMAAHFADIRTAAAPIGIGFAPIGFHPTATREQMPWMPKSRYAVMRRYMPQVGSRGLDMMLRTCTVQANLDFTSEADMRRKLRVALLLQPLATAIFANSPFIEGRPNGLLSNRAQVWTDTDNDRSGIPAVMLDEAFGFERYVDWVLDVPMYFVMRGGRVIDLAGQSFRAHLAGRLDPALGPATMGDFADHLTTVFTDVRLKRYLEMRGADAGSPAMMLAQSALWMGLLYDGAALDAASALTRRHPVADFTALRAQVPHTALDTPWQAGTLRDLARDVVAIARDGLRARGMGEELYLAPLEEIASGAPTQAEHWLQRYHGAWGGDARRIFVEAAV